MPCFAWNSTKLVGAEAQVSILCSNHKFSRKHLFFQTLLHSSAIPKINIFDSMPMIGHKFILPRFARHTENFPGSDFLSYKLLSFL